MKKHSKSLAPSLPLTLAMLASLAVECPAGPVNLPPNIVVLYGDDIGYGDFGCYGATAVRTPNVDRVAREGLRFTSAYASAATCTPSRYSLLTGEYAFRKKDARILAGDAALIIDPARPTLPGTLKQAGYTTAVVGKWHLGLGSAGNLDWNRDIKPGPLEVGFDYSFIMAATGDRVPCVYVENHRVVGLDPKDPIEVSYKTPFPGEPTGKTDRDSLLMDWSHTHNDTIVNGISRLGFMRGGKAALWKDDDMADVFTRHAIDFIEQNRSKPFFLYFNTHDIHVPRVPHQRHAGKTTMGPRGDAIVQFDDAVGTILAALDRLGLTDNTLVIISSDNGPVLDDGYKDGAPEKIGDHRPAGPLRAGKYSSFEGGTRMPFIVRWPGRVRPGVTDAMISQVDLAASLGALAGRSAADLNFPDSVNVLPALLGDSTTGRDHLVEQARMLSLRRGNWKYIEPGITRDGLGPHVNLTVAEPGYLFDLAQDPGETKDVAAAHPEMVKELRARLENIRQHGDKIK